MTVHPSTPWWLPILLTAGLSLVSSMYVQKVRTQATDSQRIAVLETQQTDISQRLNRMESKIDTLVDGLIAK